MLINNDSITFDYELNINFSNDNKIILRSNSYIMEVFILFVALSAYVILISLGIGEVLKNIDKLRNDINKLMNEENERTNE